MGGEKKKKIKKLFWKLQPRDSGSLKIEINLTQMMFKKSSIIEAKKFPKDNLKLGNIYYGTWWFKVDINVTILIQSAFFM